VLTPTGTVFVKGRPADHPGVVTQHREAMINPYIRGLGPRLLCQVDADGWNVLAFEHIPGQLADYAPGSADLPKVVQALRQLETIPCPDLPLKRAERRWADYVEDATALGWLRGDNLLHTDFNPLNVLINGNTTRIIVCTRPVTPRLNWTGRTTTTRSSPSRWSPRRCGFPSR
jgi:hypothetical protein